MDYCDVLIIGGGPAGSSCARELRHAGFDVVVMDKQGFPRTKVCAGWITPPVLATLDVDVTDYAQGRVLQPMTGMRVSILGRKEIELVEKEPGSYGILRSEFDDYLLRRCGARLRLEEEFKDIVRVGDHWRVNDAIETKLVIGAGGHFCPIARYLGAKNGPETVVAAQEVEFEMTTAQAQQCKVQGLVPEIYIADDLNGYAWCMRKGNHLNIGLGREDGKSPRANTREFLSFLKSSGRVPADAPEKFHGHAYILYGHTERTLLADGIMLIGDAAGLAYPESGEGIRTAVESAVLAAQTICAAAGDYSRARLQPYEKQLIARFGKGKPQEILTGFWASLMRALLRWKWFVRKVVVDRYFLHRQQPALRGRLSATSSAPALPTTAGAASN